MLSNVFRLSCPCFIRIVHACFSQCNRRRGTARASHNEKPETALELWDCAQSRTPIRNFGSSPLFHGAQRELAWRTPVSRGREAAASSAQPLGERVSRGDSRYSVTAMQTRDPRRRSPPRGWQHPLISETNPAPARGTAIVPTKNWDVPAQRSQATVATLLQR